MRSSVPHCDTLTLPASWLGRECRGPTCCVPRGKWQSFASADPPGSRENDTRVTKSPDEVAPLDFEQKIVVIFWEDNVLKLSKIIFFDALFL